MALARVYVEESRAEFVRFLRNSPEMTGVFPSYASIVALAATIGFRHGKRIPVQKGSRKEPDPVPQEQFGEKLRLMDLIAVLDSQDANLLAQDEASRNQRALIFQEYCNGGLEILQERLKGSGDKFNQLILLLQLERQETVLDENSLDFLQV